MLTPAEVASMDAALRAHSSHVDKLRAERDRSSPWSFGQFFGDTYSRASEIVQDAERNHDRFKTRRDELAREGDRAGYVSFVTGIAKIVGAPLASLMAAERESNSAQAILLDPIARALRSTVLVGAALVLVAVYLGARK